MPDQPVDHLRDSSQTNHTVGRPEPAVVPSPSGRGDADEKGLAKLLPPSFISNAYAGSIVYPTGGTYGPRIQRAIQLVMLHSGSLDLEIDGVLLHVPAGHVVLLKPVHEEYFRFSTQEDSWHRWIDLSVDDIPAQASRILCELPDMLPLSEQMNRLVDIMLDLHLADSPDMLEMGKLLGLSALLLYEAETRTQQETYREHRAVHLCKKHIYEHYSEDVSLSHLAGAANVSPEHLIRLFQHHDKTTPIRFLWKFRVQRGLDLLLHTGLSIGEIADRTGFKNSYHFSRTIKQHLGQTPSELRRNNWRGRLP